MWSTGGDDCKLKGWDLRMDTSCPTFTSKEYVLIIVYIIIFVTHSSICFMFYKDTLWVCAAFTAVLIGNTCWLQAGRCPTLMISEWNKNAPIGYRFGIFLFSAATMSRFCFGIAGTWGNLLDTLLWEEGCGGSSGIQPIRACFWQLVCTITSKSWTANQHLVRMMVFVLTSCCVLRCPGGKKPKIILNILDTSWR